MCRKKKYAQLFIHISISIFFQINSFYFWIFKAFPVRKFKQVVKICMRQSNTVLTLIDILKLGTNMKTKQNLHLKFCDYLRK